MSTLPDARLTALHGQHSLQSDDFLTVCNLAKAEGRHEPVDAYGFTEFLGLAVHLFVSTQSHHRREQLSQVLSKFGSAVVVPLVKIVCHAWADDVQSLQALAQQSLERMELYPLLIGLNQVLDQGGDERLRTVALNLLLRKISQPCDRSVPLLLPKFLSEESLQLLEGYSFEETTGSIKLAGDMDAQPLIPIYVVIETSQDAETSAAEVLADREFHCV